jgi:hypothetical protein
MQQHAKKHAKKQMRPAWLETLTSGTPGWQECMQLMSPGAFQEWAPVSIQHMFPLFDWKASHSITAIDPATRRSANSSRPRLKQCTKLQPPAKRVTHLLMQHNAKKGNAASLV